MQKKNITNTKRKENLNGKKIHMTEFTKYRGGKNKKTNNTDNTKYRYGTLRLVASKSNDEVHNKENFSVYETN